MTAGQQTDHHAVHDMLLADDDFSNLLADQVEMTSCKLKCSFSAHGAIYILRPFGNRCGVT